MKLKSILSVAIVTALCLTILSCSKSKDDGYGGGNNNPPGGGGSGNNITISGMAFPANTTVKKGTVVKWYNGDSMAHTVTSDDGTSFDSGNLAAGATFSYTANTVGSFKYHCNYHSGMKGTLTVTQ